jgi:hypothetical protein
MNVSQTRALINSPYDLLQGRMFFEQCVVSLLKLNICILGVVLVQVLCMYGASAEFCMRERARLKHEADLEASC